jgi:hypothetical protein
MIVLWKGKNPIYFGVIRSKVKVTITLNIIFYRLIIYIDGCILWCTHFLLLMWSSGKMRGRSTSSESSFPFHKILICLDDRQPTTPCSNLSYDTLLLLLIFYDGLSSKLWIIKKTTNILTYEKLLIKLILSVLTVSNTWLRRKANNWKNLDIRHNENLQIKKTCKFCHFCKNLYLCDTGN